MTTTPKKRKPGGGRKRTGKRKHFFQIGIPADKIQILGGKENVKKYLQDKADEL